MDISPTLERSGPESTVELSEAGMGETLTNKLDRAFSYAHEVHDGQFKKGTSVPYLGHLMGVSSIVLGDGGTEDEAVAALLHDAAEDHGGRARLDDIRSRFGDSVARIVEDCTDSWDTPKPSWLTRKQAYIQRARTLPSASLRVSIADKVHNTYGILRDLRNIGEKVWERYDVSADDVLAYYESLVRAYREAGGGKLVDELERIVRGIQREMGY
jgi:(p)ppGpp synthase/HD superfamily hydrolase